jgi:uncharacterized membrane protein (DUF106 family)
MTNLTDNKKGKGGFGPIIVMMFASYLLFAFWNQIPFLKNAVHSALDPSVGALLQWNVTIGMIIVVLAITLITTLIQKYTTDQKALKELREEQKILQEEMKKFRDNPEKIAELSKKQMEFLPKTFKLTSRSVLYTGLPFILFFRWFSDFFTTMGNPKFFGFMTWFWFYFIFTILFSTFLRKWLKVV